MLTHSRAAHARITRDSRLYMSVRIYTSYSNNKDTQDVQERRFSGLFSCRVEKETGRSDGEQTTKGEDGVEKGSEDRESERGDKFKLHRRESQRGKTNVTHSAPAASHPSRRVSRSTLHQI